MATTLKAAVPEQISGNWKSGLWAMFGKEFKQNAKWAILGLIALGIALTFAIGHNLPHPGNPMSSDQFDGVWNDITITMSFGAPLVALLLGLLQILPEQRRDLWAFLIHRPVPRATLFWGKCLAGLSLYALATLLPLGAAVAWVRTPGNVAAPFDPRLTLGALAGILMGISFYFAGMLTALRPARWYGSRALPIAAALGAAVVVLVILGGNGTQFWVTAVISLLLATLFCLVSRGSFITTGIYESQPRVARAGLSFILYLGLVVAIAALAILIGLAHNVLFPTKSANYSQREYEITWAGQIVRATLGANGSVSDVQTLDGSPLQVPRWESARQHGKPALTSGDFLNGDYVFAGSPNAVFSSPDTYIVSVFSGPAADEQWFYVQRTGRFVGYNMLTRQPFGLMRLPGDGTPHLIGTTSVMYGMTRQGVEATHMLLAYPHALYWLNPETFKLMPVAIDLRGEPIKSIAYLSIDAVIVTNRELVVLTLDGDVLFSVPRAVREASYDYATAAGTFDGKEFFVWYHARRSNMPDHIYEYGRHGTLIRHVSLPPLSLSRDNTALTSSASGLVAPPLASVLVAWENVTPKSGESRGSAMVHESMSMMLLLMTLLQCLVSVFLAWRIGLRCAYTRAGLWAWSVGVFFLGFTGVLLMLCLRDWPAREICPNCGRRRVVTRELCEHCGAPFAPRVLDGTEIFEESEEGKAHLAPIFPV